MEHGDAAAELGRQLLHELGRQRDLRHQQHGAAPEVEAGADQAEVDRRLAAACDAVEQGRAGLFLPQLGEEAFKGRLLLGVQYRRLRRGAGMGRLLPFHSLLRLREEALIREPPQRLR